MLRRALLQHRRPSAHHRRPGLKQLPDILPVALILLLLAAAFAFGSLPAAAAITAAPALNEPAEGATLSTFSPTLTWTNPPGAAQYQLQVIPYNNDGPGLDLHVASPAAGFRVPAPPEWYGLLPDMTYTWRVRVSDAPGFAALDDPSWGPWAERRFHTPKPTSTSITLVSPATGTIVPTMAPVLQWANRQSGIYCSENRSNANRRADTSVRSRDYAAGAAGSRVTLWPKLSRRRTSRRSSPSRSRRSK